MINNLPISIEKTAIASLESEFETSLQQLCQRVMTGEKLIGLLQQYRLLPILQRELIIDRELGSITCSQSEVLSEYKKIYHKYQINSDADRELWLERNHCNLDRFEHLVLKTIELDRFKQTLFGSRVDSHFLQRKSQLDRAVYSVLRVKDIHLAQELFFRVQDGEATFTELVRQYSGGEEAEMGGLVGPHEISLPHPALAQRLITLKAGELSTLLPIADWFVICSSGKPSNRTVPSAMILICADSRSLRAIGIIRGVHCESAIGSTEVTCLAIPTEFFMQVVKQEGVC